MPSSSPDTCFCTNVRVELSGGANGSTIELTLRAFAVPPILMQNIVGAGESSDLKLIRATLAKAESVTRPY